MTILRWYIIPSDIPQKYELSGLNSSHDIGYLMPSSLRHPDFARLGKYPSAWDHQDEIDAMVELGT